ncbi:hypothetical protein IV203_033939 [Nitzschia inconspicua]|uniref:Uncharacterized protein n=1 Tax=Nitzschia inconspicua TaxID=303405 RepID=A0A9K3M4N8_9STRA|nr:hypothetical protein IV203_033939 [Nitzschia inconspicua]
MSTSTAGNRNASFSLPSHRLVSSLPLSKNKANFRSIIAYSSQRNNWNRNGPLRSFTSSSSKDLSSSKTNASASTTISSSNWWIRLGWTLLGLVVIDQVLQLKQEWEDSEKKQILHEMQLDADANNIAEFDATLPTLFECKLLHVEPSLDGTKMLTRLASKNDKASLLQAGDVVEVLQANVGPNQAYHLCRIKCKKEKEDGDDDTTAPLVGWYPVMFLERVA